MHAMYIPLDVWPGFRSNSTTEGVTSSPFSILGINFKNQKLQKFRKNQYQSFVVLSNFTGFPYFFPNILSGTVVPNPRINTKSNLNAWNEHCVRFFISYKTQWQLRRWSVGPRKIGFTHIVTLKLLPNTAISL